MKGVKEAAFSYENAEGFVTFDPTQTSPEEFLAELARMTDYRGTVRAEPGSESAPLEAPAGSREHSDGDEHEAGESNDGVSR
ncbi:MAG: hypothetical protein BMS9Abin29_1756 [Gemmatimonadota bacterium]|nr:MAG: hypothetical protein BMS9Abin29_1756 [Gemmatimonadota bacterium]